MIGVVLWSDPQDRKAVFWCEDHGDLAYYDGSAEIDYDYSLLSPGDMVEFDMLLSGKVRRAENARLVKTKVCNGLQDHLRNTAENTGRRASRNFEGNVVDMLPLARSRQA